MDVSAIMQTAEAAYNKDRLFRQIVQHAVHEALQHAETACPTVDRRDIDHVATVAAMAALRIAIDNDQYLKAMEFERDAALKLANDAALMSPQRLHVKVAEKPSNDPPKN